MSDSRGGTGRTGVGVVVCPAGASSAHGSWCTADTGLDSTWGPVYRKPSRWSRFHGDQYNADRPAGAGSSVRFTTDC